MEQLEKRSSGRSNWFFCLNSLPAFAIAPLSRDSMNLSSFSPTCFFGSRCYHCLLVTFRLWLSVCPHCSPSLSWLPICLSTDVCMLFTCPAGPLNAWMQVLHVLIANLLYQTAYRFYWLISYISGLFNSFHYCIHDCHGFLFVYQVLFSQRLVRPVLPAMFLCMFCRLTCFPDSWPSSRMSYPVTCYPDCRLLTCLSWPISWLSWMFIPLSWLLFTVMLGSAFRLLVLISYLNVPDCC